MLTSPVTTPPPGAVAPQRSADTPPAGTRLGPHYVRCFGCGDHHPTGLHLDVTVGEGVEVTATFTVTEDHQGAPGLAHGGVLAAAFDEALGFTAGLLRVPAVTGRLETDFVRPVPVGSTLHIHAACVGVEGRKVYTRAEGRLGSPDGEVALRAAGLFVIVPVEHFAPHAEGVPEEELGWRMNP